LLGLSLLHGPLLLALTLLPLLALALLLLLALALLLLLGLGALRPLLLLSTSRSNCLADL
jgi:hypothetical protein